MEIRPLTASDAPAYWNLRQQSLEEEPLAYGTDAEEHRLTSIADTAERLVDHRTDPLSDSSQNNFTLGIFLGGAAGTQPTLVGIATFVRSDKRKERHKGHLVGVFLAAPYRGRGLARALLTAVLARAADDPTLDQVLLGVSSTQQSALRLYLQLGFSIYGTEPRALKIGDTLVDEHLMIRLLR